MRKPGETRQEMYERWSREGSISLAHIFTVCGLFVYLFIMLPLPHMTMVVVSGIGGSFLIHSFCSNFYRPQYWKVNSQRYLYTTILWFGLALVSLYGLEIYNEIRI